MAEEAAFAPQNLARGIFPSALADQGLAAALRTQASRMLIATYMKANPNLAGRRFGRELEFVTLLEQAPRTLPRQVLTLSDQHPQAYEPLRTPDAPILSQHIARPRDL